MKLLNLLLCLLMFLSIESNAQTPKDSLYVFVGKKISVTYVDEPQSKDSVTSSGNHITTFNLLSKYKAVYEIVQSVYNKYKKDTIEFWSYDHEQFGAFAKYDMVLLAVQNYNGSLIHERYLFYDVYPTKSGCWASPGTPYRFIRNQEQQEKIELKKFKEPVVIDRGKKYFEWKINFDPPYFYREGEKIIAYEGVCVNQIMSILKRGRLKRYFE